MWLGTYKIIGSLMYLTNTGLDICFAVNTLRQYLVKPRRVHLIAAKNVMRYLKGTIDFGLYHDGDDDYILYDYTNADCSRSSSNRKRTSGGCYCMRSTMISWFSRKKYSVSLSRVGVEFVAAFSTSCEAISLWKLMSSLFDLEVDTIMNLCENHNCINMMENPLFHDNSKHI